MSEDSKDSPPPSDKPAVVSPEGKDAATIVNELTTEGVIDITEGFPAENGQQLAEIILGLFLEKDIPRIPIIGTETGVYMLTDPELPRQHLTLWQKLGEPDDVGFTTSIEGFEIGGAPRRPYLELKNIKFKWGEEERIITVYLRLGLGTDLLIFAPDHQAAKEFTLAGQEKIREIFDIEGVNVQLAGSKYK